MDYDYDHLAEGVEAVRYGVRKCIIKSEADDDVLSDILQNACEAEDKICAFPESHKAGPEQRVAAAVEIVNTLLGIDDSIISPSVKINLSLKMEQCIRLECEALERYSGIEISWEMKTAALNAVEAFISRPLIKP